MARRQRGNGSIFQRSRDGKWIAQLSYTDALTRKRRTVSRVAASRAEARARLAELKQDAKSGAVKAPRTMTFKEYAVRWLDVTLPLAGLRPRTVAMNRSRVNTSLIPLLGAVPVAQLTPTHIESFRHELANRKGRNGALSQSTQRIDFDILSKILANAVRDGLLAKNPCDSVARPKQGRSKAEAHSSQEVGLILAEVQGERIEPLVRFVADTGCRIGEALGLEWRDVDLKAKTATIKRSSSDTETTKTDAGTRVVPLLPEVVESLTEWRRQQREYEATLGEGWPNKRGLVFTTSVGTPLQYRNATRSLLAIIDRVNDEQPESDKIGLSRPWHTFRHSLAARLLNRGVPMPVVSSIVGHASIRTTVDIYGHAEAAISAEAMASALGRA